MRIKYIMILLLSMFIVSFWWSGGHSISEHYIPAMLQTQLAPLKISGIWERCYRIIALKSAVDAKIDKKHYIVLQDIPLELQHAIVAVEDNRFYKHVGFDIEGIARATLVNMQSGGIAEGGSTITQQLVKNLFLTQDRTYLRKLEEFALAIDMELRYSKDDILELYLNSIYFGSGGYGIGDASRIYFGKPPSRLNLGECTLLAGLPNAPSLTSPYVDFIAAKQRQAVVIGAMVRQGYLDSTQAQEAKITPIRLAQ